MHPFYPLDGESNQDEASSQEQDVMNQTGLEREILESQESQVQRLAYIALHNMEI